MTTQLSDNYILNPLLHIKGYQELKGNLRKNDTLAKPTIKKIKEGKLFLLSGRFKDYLINDTIHTFLSCFLESNTLEEASTSFSQKLSVQPKEAQPTINGFFKNMLHQGILISMSEYEEAIQYKMESAATERTAILAIGTKLKDFQIKKVIAIKPKFDIYLAKHKKTKQKVVIKTALLDKTELEKWERRERKAILRQEFQLLKEVAGHPNICQFIKYHKNNGQPFGVMEFIDGLTLGSYLRKKQPSLQEKMLVIQQMFEAIGHVHSCGIVHGDLHKSNFLINKKGQVKLFDFDLANHHDLQEGEIKRMGGVYKYFPPEKIRKNSFYYIKAKADYRSEVYQVAVIAYYLLYERLPFKALSWRQLVKKIKKETPTFDATTPNGEPITKGHLAILNKALSKKPEDRYASGIVLAQKWKGILE